MKRSMRFLHISRHRAPIVGLVLAVLLLPFAVQAQMPPAHGMKDMEAVDNGTIMKSMQGGSPPPDARDPDAYSDGLRPGSKDEIEDQKHYTQIMLDRFEAFRNNSHGQALDAQAWTGGDIDKLWFKVDGERTAGKLGATRTEALWNHVYATFWSLQAGARHDFGDGPGRNWGVIGVQGLAPYWFDVQASAYVGPSGRTALRMETEYDLYVTQRLVLQPNVKLDVYGKRDPARAIGAGLSSMEAGLRLRYEFTRKLAPYVGVVWNGKFAGTAQYARDASSSAQETRIVGGLRIWY